MTRTIDRKYRIEYWARSNLHSFDGKRFSFEIVDAEITIYPPSSEEDSGGFIASIALGASSLTEAEVKAHAILTRLLDLLAYEMKVFGIIERIVRSQIAGSSNARQCALYRQEKRERPLFLLENQAAEIQKLLNAEIQEDVKRALYWLRWSYRAITVPVSFPPLTGQVSTSNKL